MEHRETIEKFKMELNNYQALANDSSTTEKEMQSYRSFADKRLKEFHNSGWRDCLKLDNGWPVISELTVFSPSKLSLFLFQ